MVEYHTFYFYHWSLVVSLVIIQGCIDLWHTPCHIIDHSIFLHVINFPTVWLSEWTISPEMISPAIRAFQRFSTWVVSLYRYKSRGFISIHLGKVLLKYTPGWEVHSVVLLVVFKSRGFAPFLLKFRTILLFPVSTGLCPMSILLMTICCLSYSIF